MAHESQINGLDDVVTAVGIITQTRNSFPRTSGYSPLQWVLGVPDLRFPASLLSHHAPNLEVMEAYVKIFNHRWLAAWRSARVQESLTSNLTPMHG